MDILRRLSFFLLKLQWTQDAPARSGWYWWKLKGKTSFTKIVILDRAYTCLHGQGERYPWNDSMGHEIAGPIDPAVSFLLAVRIRGMDLLSIIRIFLAKIMLEWALRLMPAGSDEGYYLAHSIKGYLSRSGVLEPIDE